MNKKPIIAISTGTYNTEGEYDGAKTAINMLYSSSIAAAGGVPMIIPNHPDMVSAGDILSRCDGLLLSGGGDVDPGIWGEVMVPECGKPDPARDEMEIQLARMALQMNLPTLGICRGVQLMAAATGGSLYQDIPSMCLDSVPHQTINGQKALHELYLAEGLLRKILCDGGESKISCSIIVNSYHHQAVKNIGNHYVVSARTNDGIIEAIESPENKFSIGVQWHPERMLDSPEQNRLFSSFVAAASEGVK
ncbi:MAG: type 1 glutamine amidotransferase [bacterium]